LLSIALAASTYIFFYSLTYAMTGWIPEGKGDNRCLYTLTCLLDGMILASGDAYGKCQAKYLPTKLSKVKMMDY